MRKIINEFLALFIPDCGDLTYLEHARTNLAVLPKCIRMHSIRGFLWHLAHAILPIPLTSHEIWGIPNPPPQGSQKLYRVTADGIGVYEAAMTLLGWPERGELLRRPEIKWIRRPPNGAIFAEGARCFFTEEGYEEFMKKTAPLLAGVVAKELWRVTEVDDPGYGPCLYRDKHQAVLRGGSDLTGSRMISHLADGTRL